MRFIRPLLLTALALSFAGCSVFNGDAYRSDVPFRNGAVQPEPEGDIEIDITTFKLPGEASLAYSAATAANDAATRFARNRLQSALMDASDRKCEVHRSAIVSTASSVNLGLGWLAAGLAGASPLIVPTLTKNAFAAASALATTSRSLVNEEVYKKLLVTSILQAITSERDSVSADIERKRPLLPAEYSVDEAIRDAQRYHAKCSFYVGLEALSEAVEEKANCEATRLRREVLLGELSNTTISTQRKASYEAELATLEARANACN